MANKKDLMKKAISLRPTIQIGKAGLTESTINEITKQLKKRRTIKIKLLKSFMQDNHIKEVIDLLLEKTSSIMILKRGHTITLQKK